MTNRRFGAPSAGVSIAALCLLAAGSANAQFAITPNANGGDLAAALDALSPAVTITSATYTGASGAAGTYVDGPSGIADGIIITSGLATNALPPSGSGSTSTQNNQPGDPLCDPLTAPFNSQDRARLDMTFDLAAGFDGISFQLLFGSEEFPEYVGSSYNDTVGVYLNGTQVAFDNNGNAITINGPFFSSGSVEVPPANGLEYDGSTPLLITQAQAVGGSTGNTLTVVVCDAGDQALDSGALLANLNGCVGNNCTGTIPCTTIDDDFDGVNACTDCDDTNANVYPGAAEVCDGLDNDCDGFLSGSELDNDGDTYAACEGDCDDTNANVNPSAPEDCNGVDDNCNGIIPADESDADGDGFATCDGDCDDGDANTFPGAVELCDGLDNDCDGLLPTTETDDDGDGQAECEGDCDDADANNFFGNIESCDGQDNDCNGADDVLGFAGSETDNDGDGQVECAGDCDDADAANFLGNAEVCDGQDNDCNGADDVLGYDDSETDNDGDGQVECAGDCDDADANNYTGNTEACDGQDNNCDGGIDEGYPDFDGDTIADCVDPDDDNDGVDDGADECAETIIDDWAAGVPSTGTLGSNRWMYDAANDTNGDGSFTQGASGNGKNNGNGNGNNGAAGWTFEDTAGCSCAQIIDELGLGNGHTKHGCSNSAMEDWNAIVNP